MTVDGEDVLWTNLLEAFEEDRRHQAFLAYCRETQSLDRAAKRYREQAANEEISAEHRAIAEKKLKAIMLLAIAHFAAATPKKKPMAAGKVISLIAGLLLAASVLILAWALALR